MENFSSLPRSLCQPSLILPRFKIFTSFSRVPTSRRGGFISSFNLHYTLFLNPKLNFVIHLLPTGILSLHSNPFFLFLKKMKKNLYIEKITESLSNKATQGHSYSSGCISIKDLLCHIWSRQILVWKRISSRF